MFIFFVSNCPSFNSPRGRGKKMIVASQFGIYIHYYPFQEILVSDLSRYAAYLIAKCNALFKESRLTCTAMDERKRCCIDSWSSRAMKYCFLNNIIDAHRIGLKLSFPYIHQGFSIEPGGRILITTDIC